MKRLISVILALLILITGLHMTYLPAKAEEERKYLENCTFVDMQGESRYAGSKEKIIMLPPQRYTGSEITPAVTMKDGNYTLQEGTDYTVSPISLADNVNINTNPWLILSANGVNDQITGLWVTGIGNYKGNVFCTFPILSENQKVTENHFIYSDKKVFAGYDGITIDGYFGTESEIVIPYFIDGKPVQEINQYAFDRNPTITEVDISDNVYRILKNAFYNCQSLKEVRLSRQLYGIAECAFADCTLLEEITLPESLQVIGNDVFGGCLSMQAVHAASDTVYDVDGVLYRTGAAGYKDLYFYPPAKPAESCIIPDGTTRIYSNAFRYAGNLRKIVVPASMKLLFAGKYGSYYGMTGPVNITYKHTEPCTLEMGILGPDTFYDLPAGSTVTVKNEAMKAAAESAITEICKDNVTVILDRQPATGLTCQENRITLSKSGKESHTLNWNQFPADTTEAVSWVSSNEQIATADRYTGIITARNYGTCTVTGTDESGHSVQADVLVYDPCIKHEFLVGDGLREDTEHFNCHFEEIVNGKKEITLTLTDANWNPESWGRACVVADGYAGHMPVRIENSREDILSLFRTDDTYYLAAPLETGEFDRNHYTTTEHPCIFLDFVGLQPGTATLTAIFDDYGNEIRETITIHVVDKEAPGTPDSGNPNNSKEPESLSDTTREKKTPDISYSGTCQKTYGSKPFKLNVKQTSGNGKLKYSSSDKKVVTVNSSTGKVTIKGTGRCIISVTAGETDTYRAKTIKITLNITPKKQTITTKILSGNRMAIKWKKDTRATGYQIQYAADKKFKKNAKSVTVKKNQSTSKTITKLKKGKYCYTRVRSFKTIKVKGKTQKLYGPWSNIKKSGKIR